jgi:hypothetical protein
MNRFLFIALAACSSKPAIDHDDSPKNRPGEAHVQLERIAKAVKKVYADTKSFPAATGALLPTGNDNAHSCCGVKDSTGAVVNKCQPDAARFKADAGWAKLEFSIEGASEYQYTYTGTAKTFAAYAIGDLDCDTEMATFTLSGVVNAAGDAELTYTPAPKNVY